MTGLLFTEPVVFWFSMWISFSWALLFLYVSPSPMRGWPPCPDKRQTSFYESVPLTFEATYFFTQQQTGLVLLATVLGAVIGNVCHPLQERLYRKYANKIPPVGLLRRLRGSKSADKASVDWNPEARLYTACFLSIAMSLGMFM